MTAAFVLGEVYASGYIKTGIYMGLLAVAVLCALEELKDIGRWELLISAFCLLCFLGGNYRIRVEENRWKAAEEAAEWENAVIWARVDWVKETPYGCAITLSQAQLQRENGEKLSQELKLYAYMSDAGAVTTGDWIQAEGSVRIFEKADNPGEFDSLCYYRSLGFHAAMDIAQISCVRSSVLPLYRCLTALRESLREVFSVICTPEAAGIYQAMLLGERSGLEKELKELYSAGGISHILAISGLHIAVIGMGMYRICRRFGGFSFSGLIAGGLLSLYVMFTGSAVSACRAGIMFVVQLCSFVCRRSYDMLSAAAFALILILWDNPMYLFHSGCQLSFGAVFAIGLIYPVLVEALHAEHAIVQAFLSSLSVSLVTFPVLAWNFYELSPYSIGLNLIVIPCMTLVMLSGILGGLLGLRYIWMGRFWIGLGQEILKLYRWLCELTKQIPGNQIIMGKPELWVLGLYYVLLVAGILCLRGMTQKEREERKQAGKRGLFLAGLCSVLLAALCIKRQPELYVCFLDVSQGDGCYIELQGVKLLVDAGSSDKKELYEDILLPFLKARGAAELDYIVVSHPDEDHISGIRTLLEERRIAVRQLVLPKISENMQDEAYMELIELAGKSGVQVVKISAGDRISGGNWQICCLYPYEGLYTTDRNEYSAVLEVSCGALDILFTGDIGEETEEYLVPYLEKSEKTYEILKVAHHGSGASSGRRFLEAVKPQLAVISCGKNNQYGHPHEETVKRLQECGCQIVRTDKQGAYQIR